MTVRLALGAVLALALTGCGTIERDLPVKLWRDIEKRNNVNATIQNNLQVLLYAGLTRKDDVELSNQALTTCLEIVGWPDEQEKEYAAHLCKADMDLMAANTHTLLTERTELNNRIHRNQEKLADKFAKYSSSHESLSTIKWFIVSIGAIVGLIALIVFLIKGI